MLNINFQKRTYTCPFCGHEQAYCGSAGSCYIGLYYDVEYARVSAEDGPASRTAYWFTCSNRDCGRTCLTTVNRNDGSQQDIYPVATYKQYPDYVPESIRSDYEEACKIIELSPKAAATLLRRCLQGMVRDFWGISKPRLIDEIEAIKDKVPASQWLAIDALRKIGNIGAHMEKDVNCIVAIEEGEALKLLLLIETLMDKWYIARHDEQQLYQSLVGIAGKKDESKKATKE